MEDPEVPTEHLHESIEEKVEEAEKEMSKKGWSIYLAISTAFMAVLAALSSLQAGHNSDEALISQVQASDQWAFYQAKGLKYDLTQLMMSSPGQDTAKLHKKLNQYISDQASIKAEAQKDEKESAEHLERHVILSRAVTFFQVSIAISAIAILTRRRFLWYVALLLTLAGAFQFILGNI
jgi:Domain of unknown function (DUF4337)